MMNYIYFQLPSKSIRQYLQNIRDISINLNHIDIKLFKRSYNNVKKNI